jgi:hypothetical protein
MGFFPAVFFLFFLIGEGLAQLFSGQFSVIPILLMMIITVSGYILSWKREFAGGLIMILGGLVMGIYLLIITGFSGGVMAVYYSLPFIIPGMLFLFSSRQHPDKFN